MPNSVKPISQNRLLQSLIAIIVVFTIAVWTLSPDILKGISRALAIGGLFVAGCAVTGDAYRSIRRGIFDAWSLWMLALFLLIWATFISNVWGLFSIALGYPMWMRYSWVYAAVCICWAVSSWMIAKQPKDSEPPRPRIRFLFHAASWLLAGLFIGIICTATLLGRFTG